MPKMQFDVTWQLFLMKTWKNYLQMKHFLSQYKKKFLSCFLLKGRPLKSWPIFRRGGEEGDGGVEMWHVSVIVEQCWRDDAPSTQEPLLSIRRSKRTSWSDGPFDKSLKIRATQLYAALAPLLTGSCAAASGCRICVPRRLPAAADSPHFQWIPNESINV